MYPKSLTALLVSLVGILNGCSTASVVVGNTRPKVRPEDVKIYIHRPKAYEEIALMKSDSMWSFALGNQGRYDAVIKRMKKRAADLGANGILLDSIGTETINLGSQTQYHGTATANTQGTASTTGNATTYNGQTTFHGQTTYNSQTTVTASGYSTTQNMTAIIASGGGMAIWVKEE